MAPVTSRLAAHPFVRALDNMMEAYGGQWPPKASFTDWPQSFMVYQHIADEMPEKLALFNNTKLFRNWMEAQLEDKVDLVKLMEDIGSHLADGDATLLGLSACLSFLANSYRWGTLPPTEEERERKYLTFPEKLWLPLTKIHDFYELVHRGNTFTLNVANCLYNNEGKPVDMRFCFNQNPAAVKTEKNFFLCFLEVENAYRPALRMMADYLDLTEEARKSQSKAKQVLDRRVALLKEIRKIIITIMKIFHTYMREEMVSMKYWSSHVESMPAWNINDLEGGASAAEAMTFSSLDEFLGTVGQGIVYKSSVYKRIGSPKHYRLCLEALEDESRAYRFNSFLDLPVEKDPIKEAHQDVVYALYNWRLFHGKVGPRYLKNSHHTSGGAVDRVMGEGETLSSRAELELQERSRETACLLSQRYKEKEHKQDCNSVAFIKEQPKVIPLQATFSMSILLVVSIGVLALSKYNVMTN